MLSMTDQVNQFLSGAALKPASTQWSSDNSLFSFWIGINDIGNSYYESGNRTALVVACIVRITSAHLSHRFSSTLLDAYFALVEKIVSI